MDWLLLTVLSAVFFSGAAVINKELMEDTSPIFFISVLMALSSLIYLPVFLYHFTPSMLTSIHGLAGFILFSLLANCLGWFSYNYALKNDPVSTVMPLNRLQPIFVAIIGFLILSETINLRIGTGIVMAALGGYIALLKDRQHLKSPIQDILTDRGEQLAILSAFFFGFAAIADRYITVQLAPEIHSFFILAGLAVSFNTYMYLQKGRKHFREAKNTFMEKRKTYLIAGILQTSSLLAIMTALSLQEASRVIPVLQLQVPITVLAGGALLHEDNIRLKLVGSAILITGVTLVAI